MAKNEIHIGIIIRQELDSQKRSVAWLAEKVGYHRSSLARMLEKTSLDTNLLCQISVELGENYLEIISKKVQLATVNSTTPFFEANKEIHIGKMIQQKLDIHKRSVAWLADIMGYHRSSMTRMLEKPSLDANLLCRISIELRENYLEFYSKTVQYKICCKNAT